MSKILYRPEIDGLRAVSVLAVIFFHFSPSILPGGFMGVDVFFVISGYLITSIIIASHQSGESWLKDFWHRRIRRIFPALAVMVLLTMLIVCVTGLPALIANTGKQAFSVSTFLANYRMLSVSGDYWGAAADYTVFLHTWSLAIEEQFYFIYPLLLAVILTRISNRCTQWILLGLFLMSLYWCVQQTSVLKAAAFYLLPARAWELLAGALIAFSSEKFYLNLSEKISQILADAGIVIIIASFVFLPAGFDFPGKVAVIPVFGAVLFILFSAKGGLAARMLSTSPALLVGKASYSLYLWHWPMLVVGLFFAKLYEVELLRSLGILIGITLGFLSYRWVEPVGRRTNFVKIIAPMAAIIIVTFSILLSQGVFTSYNGKYKKDWRGEPYDALVNRDTPFIQRAFRGLSKGNIQWHYLKGNKATPPELILLGDSHALSLASRLDELARNNNKSLAVCAVGGWTLAPTSEMQNAYDSVKKSFYEKRINLIKEIQPKLIIISARWENVKGYEALNEIRSLIERVHSLSPQSKFIIIGQAPVINYAQYSGIYAHEWMNWRNWMHISDTTFPALTQPSFHQAHAILQEMAKEYNFITFIPVADLFPITNGRVDAVGEEGLLYYDGDHLSDAGAQRVVAKIAPTVRSLLKSEK